jgi:hypothetical protein
LRLSGTEQVVEPVHVDLFPVHERPIAALVLGEEQVTRSVLALVQRVAQVACVAVEQLASGFWRIIIPDAVNQPV